MRKKIFSILLSVAMVMVMMPSMAFAAEGTACADEISCTHEAAIGSMHYSTLEDAINVGGEIKLLKNVDKGINIPAGKTVVLDLNQKKIETTSTGIYNAGTLTVKNGTIKSTTNAGIAVGDNSVTTIESGTVVEGREGAVITGYATGATININGGNFSASDNAVLAGNGSKREGEANTFNINGGTFTGNIETSGYIACGIYAPWKDVFNVNGGTFTINGGVGVAARAGQINIVGGTFNVTGAADKTGWVGDNKNKLPCSALAFDSKAAYPALTDNAEITVTGGTFTSESSSISVIKANGDENDRITVSGGTFSSDPTSYVASGYVVSGSGPYTVSKYVAPTTPTEKDPVSNEGTAGTDNATTNADLTDKVTTSDGKTEAVVDQVIADKIVDKAVENKSTEVVVEATTAAGKSDASQVALPESTVKAIAEQTDAALTIKTDNAEVTLDKEAVSAVADQAGTTGTVKLVVETVENTAEKVVVELKLETSNGYVSDFKGGNVTVTVPVAKDMADKKVVCVYIDDNGIYHKVDGAMNEAGTHYTFTTGHFSTYAIMSEEEADAVIKDQTAAAQKAAIKKVKTTVTLSTKNVKKGIKVTVKVPVDQKADKTGIILYRSMKKGSGYAMYKKVETKNSTYIITNTKNVKGNRLTAGKRYYYKARAYKVIDGKTYYGPMSTVKYMKAK